MKTTIIICTKDREKDLIGCINSINRQTVLPNELIIVDDGNLDNSIIANRVNKKIKLRYFKKSIPGLPASRNLGVRNSLGDVIFFFDDDIVLHKDYIKNILMLYRDDSSKVIKGMGGLVKQKRRKLYDGIKEFLESITLVRPRRPGIVSHFGFCNAFQEHHFKKICNQIPNKINVQSLSGCCMSFRKEIFKEILFDKNLTGYALGEDLDFTYRIFKKYPKGLYICPRAKIFHKMSKISRINIKDESYKSIVFKFYFFKKYIEKTFKNYFINIWSIFGLFFLDIFSIIALLFITPGLTKIRSQRLIGHLKGLTIISKVILLKRNIKNYL
jgi:glycosyltransferase involved in cell wall biosynthesis